MARFGKLPVKIAEGVKVEIQKDVVKVVGPKGTLERPIPQFIKIDSENDELTVKTTNNSKKANALQGTMKSHLVNMIAGVTEGWSKELEVNGAGYRAEVKGKELVLTVGYSHPVLFELPEGVAVKVEKNIITIEGPDKERVGQLAAIVRKSRKPNVYTGSGVKYVDEVIRRKAGKQAAKE